MELWYTEEHTPTVRFSIKVKKQLFGGKSPFQQIDVFDSEEFGRFFTLDGLMMLTEKDEFIYHDMIVHVPMATNPDAVSYTHLPCSIRRNRAMFPCVPCLRKPRPSFQPSS